MITKPKQRAKSLPVLIKELDTLVSLFVRLEAADENGSVKCISCDEKIWWADADCCHFKDRDNMGTRFYLPNLAPGCRDCNRFNPQFHLQQWESWMSQEVLYDLDMRASSTMKFTRPELEEMISDYKEKVKQLRKDKGL